MVDIQPELGIELERTADRKHQQPSEEYRAPNGRVAVMVDGKWAGYMCDDTGGSRGRGSREMALFHVEELPGGVLKATYVGPIPRPHKKELNKRLHHDRAISFFVTTTDSGDRCQLFTL